jgi:hypothetical protein
MKIIFFILAAFLAIALAAPAPEAEAVADSQYYLSDVYGDYGLDAYPEANPGWWFCRRRPWHPRCRLFGK